VEPYLLRDLLLRIAVTLRSVAVTLAINEIPLHYSCHPKHSVTNYPASSFCHYGTRLVIRTSVKLWHTTCTPLNTTCTLLEYHFHTTFIPLAHHLHRTCTQLAHHLHATCIPLAHHLNTTCTSLANNLHTTFTSLAHHLHTTCTTRTRFAHHLHTTCTSLARHL